MPNKEPKEKKKDFTSPLLLLLLSPSKKILGIYKNASR